MQLILFIHGLCIGKFSLLKCSCNPKINTCSTFTVIHRNARHAHVRRGKKLESPNAHVPSWGQTVKLCLLVSALTNKCSFTIYLMPHSSHLYAFCWWNGCLQWPPSIELKYFLVFLSARRLTPCRENTCVR